MILAARPGAQRVPGRLGSGIGAMTGGAPRSPLRTNFLQVLRRQNIEARVTSSSSWCSSPISLQAAGSASTSAGMMTSSTTTARFSGKSSAFFRRCRFLSPPASPGAPPASRVSGRGSGFPSVAPSKSRSSWSGSRRSELLPKSLCCSPAMIWSLRAISASAAASRLLVPASSASSSPSLAMTFWRSGWPSSGMRRTIQRCRCGARGMCRSCGVFIQC